ncbi:unnamed protein product [Oikopleura dioica]|uniref:BTB domain-containing protein n=1 Tax=Oikopleura dioica TaxID=34765 RepID=E4XHC4_OIKDI|nr:unnamed protein product [Oikopleura dioica]CBY34477.1 unnamed protein product [Oikopleura dioica]
MAHQDAESAKNEVEMESCSESMAPGAWAGSTAANVNEKFKNDAHPNDGFSVMNELRKQGSLCDVTLVAEGRQFPVHKVVLVSSSPYFRAMFNGTMSESSQELVNLPAVQSSALRQLIEYIYSGEVEVTEENVQSLLPAANLLQLSWVRDSCCRFLQSHLHPSNCLGIRSFADVHSCSDLLVASTNFTEENFAEVVKGEEFLNLNEVDVCALFSSDQLSVISEEKVFEAAMEWVRFDVAVRNKSLRALLEHVRLPLLTKEFLVSISQENELLKDADKDCKDLIIEALTYHLLPIELKTKQGGSTRTRPRLPLGLSKVLIIVGGQAPKAIKKVEAYDYKNECWQRLTDMTTRRCRAGVANYKGFIWAVGGFNGSQRVRTVDIFDPVKGEWNPGPPMDARRSTLGAAVLNNNLYAVGGFDGASGLDTAEVYSEKKECWCRIADMTTRRSSVGVGVVGSFLYAVGGYDGCQRQCLNSVERYDPDANEWSKVADMTTRRSGAGVGVVDGLLYAVGGHDGPKVRKSAEFYNPQCNSWTQIADMLNRRRNAGVAAVNGMIYVVGGDDGTTNLNTVEFYNPQTDTWQWLESTMEVERSYAGVAVIDNPQVLEHFGFRQNRSIEAEADERVENERFEL